MDHSIRFLLQLFQVAFLLNIIRLESDFRDYFLNIFYGHKIKIFKVNFWTKILELVQVVVRADIDVQGLRTHLHKSLARNWVNTIRTSAAHPVFLSSKVSETISCEESAIFFAHLAYIPHDRQNHTTFLYRYSYTWFIKTSLLQLKPSRNKKAQKILRYLKKKQSFSL